MTYTEKELDQFLHGISLSLLSKKSAQHWRYDEKTAKEIEWLEALERKVRADKADRKTENSSEIPNNSTISKMEQVDEPQTEEHCENCRHKDECEGATYEYKNTEWWCLAYAPIDEPQRDCFLCKWLGEVNVCGRCRNRNLFAEADTEPKPKDEPQTDCDHKCIQTEIGCEKDKCPFDDPIPCEWVKCPNSTD